jgi:hypothetical protein
MSDVLPVILAILAFEVIFVATLKIAGRARSPLLETGGVYSIIVCLYTVIPLLTWARRMELGVPLGDRFTLLPPTMDQVAQIGWMCFLYLAVFGMVYLLARGRAGTTPRLIRRPHRILLPVSIGYLIFVQAGVLLVYILYDATPETYLDSYLVYTTLPTLPKYVLAFCSNASLSAEVFVLVLAFQNFRAYRWTIIVPLTAYVCISSFAHLHSRTGMAALLLANAVLYHKFVRSLKPLTITFFGSGILITIMVFGIVRDAEHMLPLNEIVDILSVSGGEFETVVNNALDIQQKQALAQVEPLGFYENYLSGFVSLIPLALGNFEKFNYETWYMTQFYQDRLAAGEGFSFGAIAEMLVGSKWTDLVIKSSIVALTFGFLQKRFNKGTGSFWLFMLELWIILWCYQAFRGSTFHMVYYFAHRFVLSYAPLWLFDRWTRDPGYPQESAALGQMTAAVGRSSNI